MIHSGDIRNWGENVWKKFQLFDCSVSWILIIKHKKGKSKKSSKRGEHDLRKVWKWPAYLQVITKPCLRLRAGNKSTTLIGNLQNIHFLMGKKGIRVAAWAGHAVWRWSWYEADVSFITGREDSCGALDIVTAFCSSAELCIITEQKLCIFLSDCAERSQCDWRRKTPLGTLIWWVAGTILAL